MMNRIMGNDIKVLNYISDNYFKCLYLYLDYLKYGTNDQNIKIWAEQEGEEINLLVLKYYSGMHLFSKENDFNQQELLELINIEKPSMICGERSVIQKIEEQLREKGYESEYGWVRELSEMPPYKDETIFKATSLEDFDGITELLYSDEDIGGAYQREELLHQIIERNKEKYGRNYVVKTGSDIVAHAGTGAENDKVAILNYVITKPEYRGKGLATKVCKAVCSDLIQEGKKVYLINYSQESTRLYDKLGFKICCEWGKLFLNLKKEG